MRLVLANHPGDACVTVRSLEASEVEALTRHFRDGVDEHWLQTWLARLWSLRLWIACGCRSTHDQSPMLFARRSPDAAYALARMPDRPTHVSGCAFSGSPPRVWNADVSPEPVPLAQLMCRWFAAARLNVVFPYTGDDSLATQYAALREVSRSMELSRGQRLFDFSRTHPRGLPELCRRLLRSNRDAHGIYLTVAPSLDASEVREALHDAWGYLGEQDLSLEQRIVGADRRRGPFVALVLLRAAGEAVCIEQVFAQPVHSARLLVPLDGATDRRTLDVLLDVQRTMLSEYGRIVTIRKTLCDAVAHERGVNFHLQPLGPNGRPVESVDVLSADAGAAFCDEVDLERVNDPLYHAVGPTDGPLTPTDQSFKVRVLSRLLAEAAPTNSRTRPGPTALAS